MERIEIIVTPQETKVTPLENFGGTNPAGKALAVNSRYVTVDDAAHLPVMGEFHFSRWPANQWAEALQKMKAGGVEVVASYIFWIHHEEIEGQWDFTGSRDLGAFLEVCAQENMPVLLRIGPWAHGEARNGGFPDWLVQNDYITPRTNDAKYLAHVKELYDRLGKISAPYLWKDGGPVLGIQLENEYGHVGGYGEEAGYQHMKTLKEMAVQAGFTVPFYTATGWGGAVVVDGEMLPVLGGYVDAPWAQHTEPLPAVKNFLLLPFHNDTNIGADHAVSREDAFTYDIDAYPYATAELGGGMQVTAHRRPFVTATDTAALVTCSLAAGANVIGYYVYHGGTNPEGKKTTLQESKATGYPNDLPIKSYDFQAPIRESGELHQSYRSIKRIHLFLQDFGELLAPAISHYTDHPVSNPEDTQQVRMSLRHNHKENCGFLFVNNYQRNHTMASHEVQPVVQLPEETITFPTLSLVNGSYGIFPYNLRLGDSVLLSTNAQLLCQLGDITFFYLEEGQQPLYRWKDDKPGNVITLTTQQADNAWRLGDSLYISAGELRKSDRQIKVVSYRPQEEINVYRTGATKPEGLRVEAQRVPEIECTVSLAEETKDYKEYSITLGEIPPLHEALLALDFLGDKAELYQNGTLIADWFTIGEQWRVALKRHGFGTSYQLRVYPSVQPVYYEKDIQAGCELQNAQVIPQYEMALEE